jgi:hypothetical protein
MSNLKDHDKTIEQSEEDLKTFINCLIKVPKAVIAASSVFFLFVGCVAYIPKVPPVPPVPVEATAFVDEPATTPVEDGNPDVAHTDSHSVLEETNQDRFARLLKENAPSNVSADQVMDVAGMIDNAREEWYWKMENLSDEDSEKMINYSIDLNNLDDVSQEQIKPLVPTIVKTIRQFYQ